MAYLYWWEQVEDGIYGEFGRPEMGWLRQSLTYYHRMLERRVSQYHYYDPLCDLLDMPLPTTPITWNPLNALQFELYGPENDDTLRLWQEAEMVTDLKNNAEIVQATLPTTGKSVVLHTELDVHGWYYTLADMRFIYGMIHGEVDLAYEPQYDQPEFDKETLYGRERYLMWWLAHTAVTLREVSGQPLPELILH